MMFSTGYIHVKDNPGGSYPPYNIVKESNVVSRMPLLDGQEMTLKSLQNPML